MSTELHTADHVALRLKEALERASEAPLDEVVTQQLAIYCVLLMRWNERTNLTAIRDIESDLSRHFVESIACARALPLKIETLLDFGSGAGFPGMPIAICRPDIRVTLAESQGKKSAFLREVARTLNLPVEVHSGRAENLHRTFDCVTLRAVDQMPHAVAAALNLVSPRGWITVMTSAKSFAATVHEIGSSAEWVTTIALAGGGDRMLALGRHRQVEV